MSAAFTEGDPERPIEVTSRYVTDISLSFTFLNILVEYRV